MKSRRDLPRRVAELEEKCRASKLLNRTNPPDCFIYIYRSDEKFSHRRDRRFCCRNETLLASGQKAEREPSCLAGRGSFEVKSGARTRRESLDQVHGASATTRAASQTSGFNCLLWLLRFSPDARICVHTYTHVRASEREKVVVVPPLVACVSCFFLCPFFSVPPRACFDAV